MNKKSFLLYSFSLIAISLNKILGFITMPTGLLILLNLVNVILLHFILRRVIAQSWKFGTYLHLFILVLLAVILTIETNESDLSLIPKAIWLETTLFSGAWLLLFYTTATESDSKAGKSENLVHAQKNR